MFRPALGYHSPQIYPRYPEISFSRFCEPSIPATGARILCRRSNLGVSTKMKTEQDQNRNDWAYLAQDDYVQPFQEQRNVAESHTPVYGYAQEQEHFPVGGFVPAGSLGSYSDSPGSYISPYSTHETQGTNLYSIDDVPEQEVGDFASPRPRKRKSRAPARPKMEQPQSKRALLRIKVARENNGEVSATDQPKGLVKFDGGVFYWWDPEDNVWLEAAYHDQYRDQFIEEDRVVGDYVDTPEAGKASNDVTSACSAFNQLQWRLTERSSWGNIVDADGNRVMYMLNKPLKQTYDPPERLWIHDGCVLLDGDNNPVRPWAGVPRCFSSKMEGGRIEALRRILPMTISDFRARMPRSVSTSAGIKPLSYPSTFGHRTSRFRDQYQCPAWISRVASEAYKKQVTDLLSEAEESTTTEGLQVLTRREVEERKSSTRNQYLDKANGRAISEDERRIRDRKTHQRLAQQAKASEQSQSMPATPGQTASSPYLPTPPSTSNKRRREDELDADQWEPAPKRGRRGATSLDPRLQSPLSRVDYRYVEPQTPLEQLRIQAALFYPRAHYYSLIGEHPPHTSNGTFADQYYQIVASFKQKWLLPGDVPWLADIGAWHGSFDDVPTPNLDDGVTWMILNPAGIAPVSEAEGSWASSADNDGPEVVQSSHDSGTVAEQDTEGNDDSLDQRSDNVDELRDLFEE